MAHDDSDPGRKELDPEDLEVLTTLSDVTEAELLAARLSSDGVDALVRSDDVGRLYPALELTSGVAVLVRREDLERAQQLMGQIEILPENVEIEGAPPTEPDV